MPHVFHHKRNHQQNRRKVTDIVGQMKFRQSITVLLGTHQRATFNQITTLADTQELPHLCGHRLSSDQIKIVIKRIDGEVIAESFWDFGGAPGFAKQSVHVCPGHGAGVIERKEWIKACLLELSLPCR